MPTGRRRCVGGGGTKLHSALADPLTIKRKHEAASTLTRREARERGAQGTRKQGQERFTGLAGGEGDAAPRHMIASSGTRGWRSHPTKGPRAPAAPSANPITAANDEAPRSARRPPIGPGGVSNIPGVGRRRLRDEQHGSKQGRLESSRSCSLLSPVLLSCLCCYLLL